MDETVLLNAAQVQRLAQESLFFASRLIFTLQDGYNNNSDTP
jgi:hypothetical protein